MIGGTKVGHAGALFWDELLGQFLHSKARPWWLTHWMLAAHLAGSLFGVLLVLLLSRLPEVEPKKPGT